MYADALSCAYRGWKVFPLFPKSKRPLTQSGFKDASDDLDQIKDWWAKWPDANIGIPTGKPNNIVVVDIDPRNGGWQSLDEMGLSPIDYTPVHHIETGSGGAHYYYSYPQQFTLLPCRKLAEGVDFKADGGYVVGSGSIHPNGKPYRVISDGTEELPETILKYLTSNKAPGPQKPKNWLAKMLEELGPGNRNDSFCRIAGKLHRLGLEDEDIIALLKPHAVACGFGEEELRLEVTTLCKRYPKGETWKRGQTAVKKPAWER